MYWKDGTVTQNGINYQKYKYFSIEEKKNPPHGRFWNCDTGQQEWPATHEVLIKEVLVKDETDFLVYYVKHKRL